MRPGALIAGLDTLHRLLRVDEAHRFLQLGVVGGQVLQQLDLAIEVDHKGAIHRPGDHLVKKAPAGAAFPVDIVALAHAGIDQQTHGQG